MLRWINVLEKPWNNISSAILQQFSLNCIWWLEFFIVKWYLSSYSSNNIVTGYVLASWQWILLWILLASHSWMHMWTKTLPSIHKWGCLKKLADVKCWVNFGMKILCIIHTRKILIITSYTRYKYEICYFRHSIWT